MLAAYNPGVGKIRHDILRFDPTELGNPLRELLRAEERWAYLPVKECKEWHSDVAETGEEVAVNNAILQKGLLGGHAAFSRGRMLSLQGDLTSRCEEATSELREERPSYMKLQLPEGDHREQVGKIQPRRREGVITWGGGIPLGDCESQEVKIGRLHFRAIDFGDTIRLSERSRLHLGDVEAQERNQCVLLHTVEGAQWARVANEMAPHH